MNRPPRLQASAVTHPGMVRPNNEDALYVNPEEGILSVADGMGGAAAGEVASSIFIEQIHNIPDMLGKKQLEGVEFVKDVFLAANRSIIQHVEKNPAHAGMGCTAELLIFCADGYVLGHVGDSRTYLFRHGIIRRLGRDHTLVQEQMDQGMLSLEEAASHPMKNVILRAVGINDTLMVDIIRGKYQNGDIFLLCSDGLTDMIPDSQIAMILSHAESPATMAARLVDSANKAGGRDNITAVVSLVL